MNQTGKVMNQKSFKTDAIQQQIDLDRRQKEKTCSLGLFIAILRNLTKRIYGTYLQ